MLNFARENYQDIIQLLAGISAGLSGQVAVDRPGERLAHRGAGCLAVGCAAAGGTM